MEESMRQPVLVILDVPEGTDIDTLGRSVKQTLRGNGYRVRWVIPVQRTDGVPAGMVTASE
jgi:hypothetical protein